MMKKTLCSIAFLSLFLLTASPGLPALEEEPDSASSNNTEGVTVESKVFIVIKFQIIKMVKRDNEEILATPVIRCLNGESATLRFDIQQGFSYTLEIIPEIVEDKEIRLKLSSKVESGMSKSFQRELLVKNNSSVVVELFHNEKDNSEVMAQITPMIEKFSPTKEYPQPVSDFNWGETMVLFNNHLVARGNIAGRSAAGVFLHLWKSGYYLFSFHLFPGARPFGFCEGNSVKFNLDENVVIEWFTAKPPLPQGKWMAWCAEKQDVLKELSDKNAVLELDRMGMTEEGEIGIWRLKEHTRESLIAAEVGPLDNKMDFEFKNGNMKSILEFVARILKAGLSLDPKLNDKKLTCEFYQVPLRQFLDFICKIHSAKWELTKGESPVLRVQSL